MTCEATREQLMALEVAAFDGVEHLATCAACRAFADQLRQTDTTIAAHVETFAARGDFEQAWARARAEADRPAPGLGWRLPAGAVGAALALAALVLFVAKGVVPGPPTFEPVVAPEVHALPVAADPTTPALEPTEVAVVPFLPPVATPDAPSLRAPPPAPPPAVAMPDAPRETAPPTAARTPESVAPPAAPICPTIATPPADPPELSDPVVTARSAAGTEGLAEPAFDPSPDPVVREPLPSPTVDSSARPPPSRHAPRPRPRPTPPPAAVAAEPPAAAEPPPPPSALVIQIAAGLDAIQGARLACPSSNQTADRSGDAVRFASVPSERCTVTFDGDPARGVVTGGGSWRLIPGDGGAQLLQD